MIVIFGVGYSVDSAAAAVHNVHEELFFLESVEFLASVVRTR
jgi:hypothetical protein